MCINDKKKADCNTQKIHNHLCLHYSQQVKKPQGSNAQRFTAVSADLPVRYCIIYIATVRTAKASTSSICLHLIHFLFMYSCHVGASRVRLTVQTAELLAGLPHSLVRIEKSFAKYLFRSENTPTESFKACRTSRKTSAGKS